MKMKHGIKKILVITLIASFLAVPVPVQAATVTQIKEIAGTGSSGFYDGAAEDALFNYPYGLAADKGGGIIIVDSYNNKIRYLKKGEITTLAGDTPYKDADGMPSGSMIDGEAMKAGFNHPRDVVVDSKGIVYISDSGNNAIRVMGSGMVYTYAGAATAGYNDGKAADARFNLPSGMAIDSKDNLYVADTLNHVIRMISPKGVVTTYAGKASADGGYKDGKAGEALFNEPSDVAIDAKGTLYVLDSGNQLVRKIKNGVVSTVAGSATDKLENTTYTAGGFKNGKGTKARFNFPMGIEVTADGTLFIADTYNHRIRVIKKDGTVGTLAGSGMPGLNGGYADTAQFNGPMGLLYMKGMLYISDTWNNCIRGITVNSEKPAFVEDRTDLENSYHFDKATDEIQLWYEGSRIKLTTAKPYKEWDTIIRTIAGGR